MAYLWPHSTSSAWKKDWQAWKNTTNYETSSKTYTSNQMLYYYKNIDLSIVTI